MMVGPAPQAAVVEVLAASAPAIRAEAPPPVLAVEWSLADGQTPPPQESTEEAPPEVPDETPEEAPLGNEIVVEGEYGPPAGDPIAAVNETSYRIVQDLDSALIGPLAYGYRDGLPDPLRDGLGNVVRNLREPANFLNFLLQLKIGDAFETLGRFAINSTVGVGGLIDVAGRENIGLPYRRNGFANTLGYYGVGPGAYLYLPVSGATTVRDFIGNGLDQLVLPTAVGRPFNTPEYAVPVFIVSSLDERLEFDEELARIGEAVDPYAARRDTYLYRRERDIALLKGEEPPPPPAILIEIEQGVDAANAAEDDGDDGTGTPEPPAISYEDTLTTPDVAASLVITRPLGR